MVAERADYARQSGKTGGRRAKGHLQQHQEHPGILSNRYTYSVADEREYRLVRASDGDSFVLKDGNGRTIRVRLYGIDAPESRQPYGKQSKAHLLSLIQNRPLRLKTMYLDNYKRTVSLVYLADKNGIDELSVNQRQVQAGMAWVYDYFCTSDICKTWKLEEAMARKGTPRPLAGQRSHAAMAVASRAEKEEKVS